MKRTVLMLAVISLAFGQDAPRKMKNLTYEMVAPTIAVSGLAGTKATLTALDLGKLPQQTVKTADHGTAVTFEGVVLSDVLAKVATPTGEKFHSTGASYYLLAAAADGYKAVFAWAEVDPGFTDPKVYVVTKRDGKPLAARDGPFELVVPGEKRNGRWVRQLTSLTIQQAN
jgi:hypothetical protein